MPLTAGWLALAAKWWCKVAAMDATSIMHVAMEHNIRLYLSTKATGARPPPADRACWVTHLLTSMCNLGVLSQDSISSCHTVADVWALPITPQAVTAAAQAKFMHLCSRTFGDSSDPRTAPTEGAVACTYVRWALGEAECAPYLQCFLPWHVQSELCRLRLGGYPLRVATGRYEFDAATQGRGIQRGRRLCRVCSHVAVEDVKHFLLECPAYHDVRMKWHEVFMYSAPSQVLNHEDPYAVAYAISDMLKLRQQLLMATVDA